MRAGIEKSVGLRLGQVEFPVARRFRPNFERHDHHAGKKVSLFQFHHFVGDYAQIFRQNRTFAQLANQRIEKVPARSFHPLTINSGLDPGRNFPERLESPKMVDSHHIRQPEQPAEALHPPGVIVGPVPIPIVVGISPQLPCAAEVVRWHSGAGSGAAMFVQGE